jgi:hypothetical protein
MKERATAVRKTALVTVFVILMLASIQPLAAQSWTGAAGNLTCTGCNVGIGHTAPTSILHIQSSVGGGAPLRITSRNTNAAGFTDFFMFNSQGQFNGFQIGGSGVGLTQFGLPQANMAKFISSANIFAIGTSVASPLIFGTSDAERIRVLADGKVGIGTSTPTVALEVVGAVKATNIAAHYQDIAEWVPASGDLPPGTVVVLNSEKNNEVKPSEIPYDSRVAGVIAEQPGMTLGVASESKAQVATFGRVKVWVDATRHPIRVGDLLVTSGKEGFAMRSEPVEIQGRSFHQPGTLIGKALEPLASGEGKILVLLSLQ